MKSFYTENIADFGSREIAMLSEIFTAWNDYGLPDGFDNSGVRPAMNTSSGFVFLVNEEYQVAMLNDSKLEIYHTLPYSGIDGFLLEILQEHKPDKLNSDDLEYLEYAIQSDNVILPEHWLDYQFAV